MPAVKALVAHRHGDARLRPHAPAAGRPRRGPGRARSSRALRRAAWPAPRSRDGRRRPARGGEPLKLREQAYEGYTRSLLAREIAPGQFVTQRELVEITGFPLGAIRELVPRLEAEGLIRTAPQRGMQVPQVDLNLVRNAFQFRLFLEEPAVRLYAAQRRPDRGRASSAPRTRRSSRATRPATTPT